MATFPVSNDGDFPRPAPSDGLSPFHFSGTTVHHFPMENGYCSDELRELHTLLINGPTDFGGAQLCHEAPATLKSTNGPPAVPNEVTYW